MDSSDDQSFSTTTRDDLSSLTRFEDRLAVVADHNKIMLLEFGGVNGLKEAGIIYQDKSLIINYFNFIKPEDDDARNYLVTADAKGRILIFESKPSFKHLDMDIMCRYGTLKFSMFQLIIIKHCLSEIRSL